MVRHTNASLRKDQDLVSVDGRLDGGAGGCVLVAAGVQGEVLAGVLRQVEDQRGVVELAICVPRRPVAGDLVPFVRPAAHSPEAYAKSKLSGNR